MNFWSIEVPRKDLLKNVRRVVVKVGTSLITDNGAISGKKISSLVGDVVTLIHRGYEVIIVSSGAISAGAGALQRKRENISIPEKQAFAAVGQTILMNEYRRCFNNRGISVGQILLTEDDVKHRARFLNARHTFNALLELGVVPVVNENDSVAVKEIKFGDNDTLSAHVANIVEADLLVILSDIDGFYHDLSDGAPVEEIHRIDDTIRTEAGGSGSVHGTGGMSTKIRAAEIIIQSGEKMIIADGNVKGMLGMIMSGQRVGTLFTGRKKSLKSRKRWIAFNMKAAGRLNIDDGAVSALGELKKSLLASGITGITGVFEPGDAVEICSVSGELIGKGIVNYSNAELESIKGKKTKEIRSILGSGYYDEVINRDDMILFGGDDAGQM
jgi:glutamate 5-kinase